jgi:spermidine/putrescine transport system substrate-binding protein
MKKKNLVALLLGFTMAATAVLGGCGTSTGTDSADGSTQSTGNTSASSDLAGTQLNLYTWADMFPQEVLDGFEEETGIKINYSNFDYDEDMLAKLEETNGGGYDFVIADDYILELIGQEGLAQDLDKSKLENYDNINPVYQGQFYDADDSFTIPYGAGIPLIVYDPALVDIEITGYEDLWDPSLEDNVAIIGNYRVIDGITLKTMGESFNVEDQDVIQAAGDKLLELAPNIRAIEDNNTQDLLISGEVGAAFLYTSQVYMALNARDDLEVVYPKEGLGYGIMAGFIPSDAPNADAAYAFIDYLLRPEISAECFTYIGYFCTNKAAEEYIDESIRAALVLPDDAAEGEFIENISQEAEDLHAEIWNNFKNACD